MIISNISSFYGIANIQIIPGIDEYTGIYTYSLTSDFDYPGIGIETKTITWTLKSVYPITGGTFLDGTPWVANNGDIRLYSVNPASSVATAVGPTGSTLIADPNYRTYQYDKNNTVINPDLGNAKADNNGNTLFAGLHALRDTGPVYYSNGTPSGTTLETLYPFDGRGGKVYDTDPKIGQAYDSSQKWNGTEVTLNTGDIIVTTLSHDKGLSYFNGVNPTLSTSDRRPMIDMFGILTCIGSTFADIAANCYRPPINWDPSDRANAPIMPELDNCSGYTFDYPNYNYDGTKTWTTSLRNQFNSNPSRYQRYGSVEIMNFPRNTVPGEGHKHSWSVANDEYGSEVAHDIEVQFLAAFDVGITADIRNLNRRALVQRGIDIYGAYRSQGKGIGTLGGYETQYHTIMPLTYLATRNQDILTILNHGQLGNTANGTFLNFNNSYISYREYHGIQGQMWKYPKAMAQSNFIHGGRWQGLSLAGISSGSTFQKIYVRPPRNTELGTQFTDWDGATFIHGWTSSSLYNKSSSQRWNLSDNTGAIDGDMFLGGYIQNPGRGPTFISRIIKSAGVASYPTSLTESTSNVNVNAPQVFYLRSDIFEGGETYCNMAPYVQEDIDNDNVAIRFNLEKPSYPYGKFTYSYSSLGSTVPFGILYYGISAAGISMPNYVKDAYEAHAFFATTKWGRIGGKVNFNSSYMWGFPTTTSTNYVSYDSLIRKYYLNGIAGPTTGTAITSSELSSGTRSEFPPDETNWTWMGFSAAPNNITIVGNSINVNTNDAAFYTANSTTSIGNLKIYFTAHPTESFRLCVHVEDGGSPKLSYSTYLQNKILYIWFGGANKPIAFEKIGSDTVTLDTDYVQKWQLPNGAKTFHDFIPMWSGNTIPYRVFYGDAY